MRETDLVEAACLVGLSIRIAHAAGALRDRSGHDQPHRALTARVHARLADGVARGPAARLGHAAGRRPDARRQAARDLGRSPEHVGELLGPGLVRLHVPGLFGLLFGGAAGELGGVVAGARGGRARQVPVQEVEATVAELLLGRAQELALPALTVLSVHAHAVRGERRELVATEGGQRQIGVVAEPGHQIQLATHVGARGLDLHVVVAHAGPAGRVVEAHRLRAAEQVVVARAEQGLVIERAVAIHGAHEQAGDGLGVEAAARDLAHAGDERPAVALAIVWSERHVAPEARLMLVHGLDLRELVMARIGHLGRPVVAGIGALAGRARVWLVWLGLAVIGRLACARISRQIDRTIVTGWWRRRSVAGIRRGCGILRGIVLLAIRARELRRGAAQRDRQTKQQRCPRRG